MEIGVCGYGYSGSGALFCLLKEFENVTCLAGNRDDIEFELSYMTDGLEDLEYNLCKNPSKGTKCDFAIYRFLLMVEDIKRSYNRFTQGHFERLSKDYIYSLSQVKWEAFRYFEYERTPIKLRIYEKILRNTIHSMLKRRGIECICYPKRERYLSIVPENFEEKTKHYVEQILCSNGMYKCLLLNQPFSANNPQNSMRFFKDPICFFVDRDPRDLYVMVKHVYGANAMFIPTDTVENFITYYKQVRNSSLVEPDVRIVTIQFEDMIYHYDNFLNKLNDFIGETIGKHVNCKKYFRPEDSIKNTFVYPNYPEEKHAIEKIESELAPWLYDFEGNGAQVKEKTDLTRFTFM